MLLIFSSSILLFQLIELSTDRSFLKEICLFSFKGCAPGLYGNNCDAICPPNCRDGICDNRDGSCVNGCKDGYVESDTCGEGTFFLWIDAKIDYYNIRGSINFMKKIFWITNLIIDTSLITRFWPTF